jgi:hypothetical protein
VVNVNSLNGVKPGKDGVRSAVDFVRDGGGADVDVGVCVADGNSVNGDMRGDDGVCSAVGVVLGADSVGVGVRDVACGCSQSMSGNSSCSSQEPSSSVPMAYDFEGVSDGYKSSDSSSSTTAKKWINI